MQGVDLSMNEDEESLLNREAWTGRRAWMSRRGWSNREAWTTEAAKNSDPGDPPGIRTGTLIEGIIAEANRIVSLAPYSADLELGTVRAAPRPFMMRGVEENKDEAMEEAEVP